VRSVRVLSAARRAPSRASTGGIGLMARTPLAHRPVSGGSFGKRQELLLSYDSGLLSRRSVDDDLEKGD
jgi:hypothetical protein